MKNIFLKNKMQFSNSIYTPQYIGGLGSFGLKKSRLLWLITVLFLGILSCDDNKPNRGIAPKVADTPSPSNEVKEAEIESKNVTTVLVKKFVYLNRTKFKSVKKPGDTIELFINRGVDELLHIYSKPESDIQKILILTKPELTKDTVDKVVLTNFLKQYNEIKSRYPQAESFGSFVNALVIASEKDVFEEKSKVVEPSKVVVEKVKIDNEDKSEDSILFWIKLLIAVGITIIIVFVVVKKFGTKKQRQFFGLLPKDKNEGKEPQRTVDVSEKVFPEDTNKKDTLSDSGQKTESIYERNNRLERENKEKMHLKREEQLKKDLAESKRKQDELQADNERLRRENENKNILEIPLDKSKDNIGSTLEVETTTKAAVIAPLIEIAYLSLPMNEKIFNNSSKSLVPIVGQTFYIFSINANEITASFEFWNNPDAIKYAIDKPHSHIEPACDSLNVHNSYANQIVTVEKGQAVLEDNKWIVKTKAKIKYLT